MQDTKQPSVPASGRDDRASGHNLRHLDFDDLFLLSHLLSGKTIAATARQLGLTQPAVTQRVRKIERAFEEQILQKVGRHVRLTHEGLAICHRASEALKLMRDVSAFNLKPIYHQMTFITSWPSSTSPLQPTLSLLSQFHRQYFQYHYLRRY